MPFTCHKCGTVTLKEGKLVTFQNKTVHLELLCAGCGRFVSWKRHVSNSEFVMPFGKYRGMTLLEILDRDRHYLEWALNNFESGNLVNRIEEVLAYG